SDRHVGHAPRAHAAARAAAAGRRAGRRRALRRWRPGRRACREDAVTAVNAFAFIGLGAGIVPLGLIILLIVAVTGGRNEPDPEGERPAALYYAGVMFVALFTLLFAVFTVVASLLNLTVDKNDV